jgi:hypothetical protein
MASSVISKLADSHFIRPLSVEENPKNNFGLSEMVIEAVTVAMLPFRIRRSEPPALNIANLILDEPPLIARMCAFGGFIKLASTRSSSLPPACLLSLAVR